MLEQSRGESWKHQPDIFHVWLSRETGAMFETKRDKQRVKGWYNWPTGANPATRQAVKGKAAALQFMGVFALGMVLEETSGEALKRLTWSDWQIRLVCKMQTCNTRFSQVFTSVGQKLFGFELNSVDILNISNCSFLAYTFSPGRRISEWRSSGFVWIHHAPWQSHFSGLPNSLPYYWWPYSMAKVFSWDGVKGRLFGLCFFSERLWGGMSQRLNYRNNWAVLSKALLLWFSVGLNSIIPQTVNSSAFIMCSPWRISSRAHMDEAPPLTPFWPPVVAGLALTELALQALTFSTNRIRKEW